MKVLRKLGLIAGSGELPLAISADARARGYTVIAVGLDPLAERALETAADDVSWVNVGKLGTIIDTLKKAGVKEVVMAGKVPKSLLYKSKIIPDMRAVKVLFSLKDRTDDSIMLAITRELEKDGIKLLKTTDFSSGLLTPEGVLTKLSPSKEEWRDITFGWKIAKHIGRLDIGQTVVIKDKAVMAVEAIEGTDEAIRRGGKLAGEGAVIVKVSKPQQDMRFDVPVTGIDTLRVMASVRARVLALEAGKSILIDREKMVAEADSAGMCVLGYHTSK